MEPDTDAFASIVKSCIPTPSQEKTLNTCKFALESDVVLSSDSESDEIPVDSTGITIISPPESPNNDGAATEDHFETPAEESLPVSPGVQVPASDVIDGRSVPPENTPASAKTGESSKGSSNLGLGFPQMSDGGGNRGHGGGIWQGALFKLLISLNKSDVSPESVGKEVGVAMKSKGNVIDLENDSQMGGGFSENVIDLDDDDDDDSEEEEGIEMGGADQMTDEMTVRPKLALAIRECKEVPEPSVEEVYAKRSESCARASADGKTGPSVESQMDIDLPMKGSKEEVDVDKGSKVCEEGYAKRSDSCARASTDGKTGPSVESQMDVDLPRKGSKKEVDVDKGNKVCEVGDQGLARKVTDTIDGLKQVGLCDDGKAEAGGEKDALPVIENRSRLASRKCEEVPLNCEDGSAKKRSESGHGIKRARLSSTPSAENQMDADSPSTETTKDASLDRGKKVCEIGDQVLARKESVNIDRLKQVISGDDGKAEKQVGVNSPRREIQKGVALDKGKGVCEAGAEKDALPLAVDLPSIEKRPRLASRKCEEVPLNCEEGFAKKRSESGHGVKRARLRSAPSAENRMDADSPSKETTKDASLDRGKKVCESGDQVLVRKERVNIDRLKQVISTDVHSPRKEIQKGVALDRGKKVCESGDQILVRKGRVNLDRLKQVISSDDRKAEGLPKKQVDVDSPRKEIQKSAALDKGKGVCETGDAGLANKEKADVLKQVSLGNDGKDKACTENQMDVDSLRKETQKDEALNNDKGVGEMGNKGLHRKSIDVLDGTKKVKSSGNGTNETGVSRKRALPPSVTGQGENAKWGMAVSRSPPKFQNVEKLLNGLKKVAEKLGEGYDDDNDIDFFEMAKRRGMTFPQPRWWPPGGFP